MNRFARFLRRRRTWGMLGLLVLVAAALGLQGCYRGQWHGRYDPARFDERMSDIQADIADELELRPEQRPAFEALMAQYRGVARQWRDGWQETGTQVRQALEQEPADATAVGDALKRRMRQRVDDATLEKLIDDTVAFYQTLDPQQQEEVREHLLRHLRRRLG